MAEQPKPEREVSIAQDDQDIVDLDALIRDYEREDRDFHRAERFAADYDAPPKRKNDAQTWREQIADFLRTPYDKNYAPEEVESSADERAWAAIAHLSLLIGVPLGISSAGILAVFVAIVPLLIHFAHRERAPFAASHAMQATLALLISTIGWIGLTIGSGILGVILTVFLTFTFIGILAIPFVWLGVLLFWLALLALPFGAFFLSLVGAVQALRGRTFRYPYIGKWAR
jgi:uncharacterized Tic20 family protein